MKALTAALWSLREDAIWAHKQALEGRLPDLVTLDVAYQHVIKEVQRMDLERKA